MVQFGIWSNCCNDCKFCVRLDRNPYTKDGQIRSIRKLITNIDHIDWKDKFSHGISLLGGELYFIKDREIQLAFLELIDAIIEKILKVSTNPIVKYSTVTNCIYDPTFLFEVIDRIVDKAGIQYVDLNVSYDIKYRFRNEEHRKLVLKNIGLIRDRYNYRLGIQMILTQYVIDSVNNNTFNIKDFIENDIPGCHLTFLYPHTVNTEYKLPDFQFKRKDFLNFIVQLNKTHPEIAMTTILSTFNSESFKYTGLYYKEEENPLNTVFQQPMLTDGKDEKLPCGHSILYNCYADSNKCMVCDLKNMELIK